MSIYLCHWFFCLWYLSQSTYHILTIHLLMEIQRFISGALPDKLFTFPRANFLLSLLPLISHKTTFYFTAKMCPSQRQSRNKVNYPIQGKKLHHPGTLLLHSMTLFTLRNEFFRKNVRKEKITLICVKKKSVVQTYSIIHSIIKKKL